MLTCLDKTNILLKKPSSIVQKVLWSKSKKLKSLVRIFSFYNSGDAIKIKVNENRFPLFMTHVDDFGKYFPGVDLSSPERSE